MELTGLGAERLKASDNRIVVTGATGWLGSATLELLRATVDERRIHAFDSRNLADLADLPRQATLVFHNAFLGRERQSEPGYSAANEAIRATVFAALDPIGATAIFVPSSGAARGNDLYGECKRADEAAFAAWPGRSVIARVFNLSGPHINKRSSYALASFIEDALAGRPIAIRADRQVYRSYLAIRELMSVVAGLMTQGSDSVSFDAAGREIVEMADLAAAVGGAVTRPPVSGDPDRYLGDNNAYEAHRIAQQVAPVNFATQIRETADWLAAQRVAA